MSSEIEIILVEDNQNDADLAIRALQKQRLTNKLLHFKDGAEALDFLFGQGEYSKRNTSDLLKVIFLDIKMPRVNGIEVLRKLKSDERTKHIPVVMLTSSKEDPDIKTCYTLGANGYVVKPVNFTSFARSVSELGLYWTVLNEPPK